MMLVPNPIDSSCVTQDDLVVDHHARLGMGEERKRTFSQRTGLKDAAVELRDAQNVCPGL